MLAVAGRLLRVERKPLMPLTFDATLKDLGRESPEGFLAAFDRPPAGPVKVLNVDLSTVTASADPTASASWPLMTEPAPSRVSSTHPDPVQKACRTDARVAS